MQIQESDYMPKARVPTGVMTGGMIKIAIKLKPELFERIKQRAIKHNKKFYEILGDACECGLLCIEESENDELENVLEANMSHSRIVSYTVTVEGRD